MTESRIREFAAAHGLTVEKRITTGNEHAHFATFELFTETPQPAGPNVCEAWRKLRAMEDPNRLRGDKPFTVFHARSDSTGLPWIELDSVWCEIPR